MVIRHTFNWFRQGGGGPAVPAADSEALMVEPRALQESGNYEPALPIRNVTVPRKDYVTGWVMSATAGRGRPRCVITVFDALGNSPKCRITTTRPVQSWADRCSLGKRGARIAVITRRGFAASQG